MFTLAYAFRPWKQAKAIADGRSILEYVRDTARAFGIDRSIRFDHRVTRAAWSSADARWTVELEHAPHGQRLHLTSGFLYFCTGYYRYDTGYLPDFPGRERFAGTIVHPQHWPDGLDVRRQARGRDRQRRNRGDAGPGARRKAAHVTMLQRSPSYVLSVPSRDVVADALRRWLPGRRHRLLRWKNVLIGMALYELCRRRPEAREEAAAQRCGRELPQDYAVDAHSSRATTRGSSGCAWSPDGDLFRALRGGRASIVTDRVDSSPKAASSWSRPRARRRSLVTATGLELQALGGARSPSTAVRSILPRR